MNRPQKLLLIAVAFQVVSVFVCLLADDVAAALWCGVCAASTAAAS
jgi:hypothetical protein